MTALLTENLPLLAGAPNGIKKLRELILELAVRGRLLEQNSSGEPASELLESIAKEKTLLIENKTIRNGKPLPDIEQDEMQFKLPIGWEWVRLGQIGDWGAGATPARGNSSYYGGEMPWFKSGELVADFISDSDESVTDLALKECSLRRNKPGDVLIAMYGATIGKTAILSVEGTTNQAVCACTPFNGVFNRYLLLTLKALKSNFIGQGAGGAQPNISREKIVATVTGLPPLAEQHRIVAKVDELMALCDSLEAQQADAESTHTQLVQALLDSLTQTSDATEFATNWQRLAEHFHTLFTTEPSIDALKQTFLCLAADGRLVSSDVPAAHLSLSDVIDGDSLNGSSKKPQDTPSAVEILRISAGTGVADFLTDEYEHKWADVTEAEIQKFLLAKDDLLACRFNGNLHYVGAFSLYCGNRGVPQIFPDKLIRFRADRNKASPHYLKYILNAAPARAQIESFCATTVGNIGISAKNLKTIKLRLPSLEEQSNIVNRLDQLMALCDQLKTRLTQARQLNEQLASTLVEQAVA